MHRHSAFTLIELVVAVAILAITVMFAVPSFQNLISGNRMLEARDSTLAAIRYAKGEAVGRNRTVSVCPSVDGISCGDADDWAEGWLVVLDSNDSGAVAAAGTLRVFPGPQASEVTMTHGVLEYIRFLPNGLAEGLAGTRARSVNEGRAKPTTTAAIATVTTSSNRVKPWEVWLFTDEVLF